MKKTKQMNEEIKIEKGVPITRAYKGSKWMDVVRNWEVGDSVVVDTQSQRGCLTTSAKRHGQAVITTKLPGGRFRVWRAQ